MTKEVFIQQFEKEFTVYEQVQLIKKYINELDIPTDTYYLTSQATENNVEGLLHWGRRSEYDSDLSFEITLRDLDANNVSGELLIGNYSTYMTNHYWTIGLDEDVLNITCDVEGGMGITGSTYQTDTRMKMYAGNKSIEIDSDEGITMVGNVLPRNVITCNYNESRSSNTYIEFTPSRELKYNSLYLVVAILSDSLGISTTFISTPRYISYRSSYYANIMLAELDRDNILQGRVHISPDLDFIGFSIPNTYHETNNGNDNVTLYSPDKVLLYELHYPVIVQGN